jgi:hypothetical protein
MQSGRAKVAQNAGSEPVLYADLPQTLDLTRPHGGRTPAREGGSLNPGRCRPAPLNHPIDDATFLVLPPIRLWRLPKLFLERQPKMFVAAKTSSMHDVLYGHARFLQ